MKSKLTVNSDLEMKKINRMQMNFVPFAFFESNKKVMIQHYLLLNVKPYRHVAHKYLKYFMKNIRLSNLFI